MGQEYSNLKMAWHYVRDGGLPDAPKQAQVILSDLCNQNCHFCAYRMDGYSSNELFVGDSALAKTGHNNPVRWMPTARAMALIDELADAGVLAVQFTGGGEPTVHPEHERIFKRALERGLKCALVSNGLRWSDHLIAMLPRFSWVRVSVDAGTAETYAKIRDTPAGHFEKVWNHVARLAHAIRLQPGCLLGIGYVVTPENWQEILPGVERAGESGAAYIRLSAMFSQDGAVPYLGIYSRIRGEIVKARVRHQRPDFAIHDLFGDRLTDLEQGAPDYPVCYYQGANTYIGGDLQAYRCCVTSYSKHGKIAGGDLRARSFKEFWESPERKDDFEKFDARSCNLCQFNERNRVMNYLLSPDPKHKEFP